MGNFRDFNEFMIDLFFRGNNIKYLILVYKWVNNLLILYFIIFNNIFIRDK